MTLNNIPAPVRPTDGDSILGVLADAAKRVERNVNDPTGWIYVDNAGPGGLQTWAPAFQNGFFNVGAPLCLLRYRFLRPYDPDTTQNAVQLQGSVGGGSAGLTIFRLREPRWNPDGSHPTPMPAFTMDSDIHLTCHDDSGNLVMITVQGSTGDVIYGFV